jgi:hypothetical protein
MALALLSAVAYGQVPSTNDTSDISLNTGIGSYSLLNLTPGGTACSIISPSGCYNTAAGYNALGSMTNGFENTAVGMEALTNNIGGAGNSALGFLALNFNTSGNYNTASGYRALYGAPFSVANPNAATGTNNTGIGANALYSYSTGSNNTASGVNALYSNTIGNYNTAIGFEALYADLSSVDNTATGAYALRANNGSFNTASGFEALYHNTSGTHNVAAGFQAGFNLTTGSNNIEIGNTGAAADHNTIRIGTQGTQAATFIAGIYGHSLTGSAVVITSAGELGVVASSERFKTEIAPMGSKSSKLDRLSPVTFKLKSDASGTVQYGLIAEEVAKVYPELVIRGKHGRIDGVRYDELAPMLLNEVQKEHEHALVQDAEISALKAQLAEMHAALAAMQAEDQLVAQP